MYAYLFVCHTIQCNSTQFNSNQVSNPEGFFKDANLIACDTLLGLTMYTLACIGLILFLFTYYWIIAFHIGLGIKELKTNRWMEPIYNLEDKCLTEEQYFKDEFSIFQRLPLSIYLELRQQFWYLEDALNWMISFIMYWVNALLMAVLTPLMILYLPVRYYGKRIAIVCALTTAKRGKR